MAGITLTQDEIRSAPPEVRAWIEDQMIAIFRGARPDPVQAVARTLTVCSADEARAILEQIQSLLPVVSVFFELGRDAPMAGGQPLRVFTLAEIQRYAHLRAPEEVVQCLNVINQIIRQLRRDETAAICAIDQDGHCYVADAASRTIRTLWHEIVTERAIQGAGAGPSDQSPAA